MDPERTLPSNAVEQGGRVIGYVVKDEQGRTILVDEHGTPVRKDQADRKPVPPGFDERGAPRWVQ